ncbi:MAG: ankyrin repeat domain-containing protein [Desulfotalea sp.]
MKRHFVWIVLSIFLCVLTFPAISIAYDTALADAIDTATINSRDNSKKAPEGHPDWYLYPLLPEDKQNIITILDTGLDVNELSRRGQTSLNFAVSSGMPELVKFLIAQGADVNKKSKNDSSFPLYTSCYHGDKTGFEIVEFLLKNGANINAQTRWGETALHQSVLKGFVEKTKILLKYGAVSTLDERGKTPADKAREQMKRYKKGDEKFNDYEEVLSLVK